MKMFDKKEEIKSLKIVSAIGVLLIVGAFMVKTIAGSSNASALSMEAISKELHDTPIQMQAASRVEISEHPHSGITSKSSILEESVPEEVKELPLVFDINDVRTPSNITEEQLSLFVAKYCPKWVGLEQEILKYDNRINLIFLLAVGRAESGAGDDVVGKYNCFNVKDFYTGEYVDYDSYMQSIDTFVRLLETQYLCEEGMWWEGGYSIEKISIHYATPAWAEGITDLGEEIKWVLEERVPVWKEEMTAASINDEAFIMEG